MLWPSDIAHLLFLAGSTILLVLFREEAPATGPWIACNITLMAICILLARFSRNRRRGANARMIYTLFAIPVVFTQLGSLVPFVNPRGFEQELFDIDLWLCFGHNPVEACERIANPWLTEILQWVYDFYFFITLILAVAVVRKRDTVNLARMTFAFTLCIYLSYIGYYLVPTTGPNMDILGLYDFDSHLPGIFLAGELRETMFLIESIKQDCFPSGHTAVSVIALTLAMSFAREVVKLLIPLTLALVLSTVYLRYHYLVDVIVGVVLALVAHYLAIRWHKTFERRNWSPHGEPSRTG